MNTNESLFLLAAIWTGCNRYNGGTELERGKVSSTAKSASVAPAPAVHDAATAGKTVVEFWRQAGPGMWFAKDPAFDQRFRESFLTLHEAAARGELAHWMKAPESALALVLLLDQYPRNSFRGTPRMYATDPLARQMAAQAIAAGHDRVIEAPLRLFMYLPFGHSENLADQDRSVELARTLPDPSVERAEHHRDIVRRFGRFPHRNAILGRVSRPEEQRYLAEAATKADLPAHASLRAQSATQLRAKLSVSRRLSSQTPHDWLTRGSAG